MTCLRFASVRIALFLIASVCTFGLLSSCSTPETSSSQRAFRFWVLLYKTPVEVSPWIPKEAVAADPEGAALNIATAMQQGDLAAWRLNWQPVNRRDLSAAEQQTLLQQWQGFRESRIELRGRVIAGTEVVVELMMAPPQGQPQRVQIPLTHFGDRWWLTTMDPASEYLHWETSSNKLVEFLDPGAFYKRIEATQTSITGL